MEEINELVRQYSLEEDPEHIIIPFTDKKGRKLRRYILKRKYIRITYTEEYHVDYPLADIIRATIKHPEIPLSEALYLLYKESEREIPKSVSNVTDPETPDPDQSLT